MRPAASRQPPAASRQPPAASRQPPAASRQPSSGGRRPAHRHRITEAVSYPIAVINRPGAVPALCPTGRRIGVIHGHSRATQLAVQPASTQLSALLPAAFQAGHTGSITVIRSHCCLAGQGHFSMSDRVVCTASPALPRLGRAQRDPGHRGLKTGSGPDLLRARQSDAGGREQPGEHLPEIVHPDDGDLRVRLVRLRQRGRGMGRLP
jgi:hypothetical protein